MYYVEMMNNKIISKGCGPAKTDEQIEITKEIYDQLTRLPATYETDTEGNIISVTPAPEPKPQPQPPSIENRFKALEDALLSIYRGDNMYEFLKNMWVMKRIDKAFLQEQVTKGRITQQEYETIIATPQIP